MLWTGEWAMSSGHRLWSRAALVPSGWHFEVSATGGRSGPASDVGPQGGRSGDLFVLWRRDDSEHLELLCISLWVHLLASEMLWHSPLSYFKSYPIKPGRHTGWSWRPPGAGTFEPGRKRGGKEGGKDGRPTSWIACKRQRRSACAAPRCPESLPGAWGRVRPARCEEGWTRRPPAACSRLLREPSLPGAPHWRGTGRSCSGTRGPWDTGRSRHLSGPSSPSLLPGRKRAPGAGPGGLDPRLQHEVLPVCWKDASGPEGQGNQVGTQAGHAPRAVRELAAGGGVGWGLSPFLPASRQRPLLHIILRPLGDSKI